MIDAYTDQPITTPDFSSGQVVLYDGGVVDDSLCAHKLILRRVDAQNIAEGVVEVTLEYENFQPQSDPECGDEVIEVRPFEFFYVHSRDELVFAERIQRSEEHTSELQSRGHLVCLLLLEKKNDATS